MYRHGHKKVHTDGREMNVYHITPLFQVVVHVSGHVILQNAHEDETHESQQHQLRSRDQREGINKAGTDRGQRLLKT